MQLEFLGHALVNTIFDKYLPSYHLYYHFQAHHKRGMFLYIQRLDTYKGFNHNLYRVT